MKKPAFTLIELLIVIIIIGILGSISVRFFSSSNFSKQQTAGVECGMYITEQIQGFYDLARKSGGLKVKNKKIQPEKYFISFSKSAGDATPKIELQYKETKNSDTISYQPDNKENLLEAGQCKTSNFTPKLVMTGKNILLEMNKGFWGNKAGEIETFKVKVTENNPSKVTENNPSIIFQFCNKGEYCIDIYKYTINIATQKINASICWSYELENGEAKNKCTIRR